MIYVDDMMAPFGRMVMSHMIADSDEELHAMADAIGVARKWWQAPPTHDSHYDISKSRRERALDLGAKAITWREAAMMTVLRRYFGYDRSLVSPEEGFQLLQSLREARQRDKLAWLIPMTVSVLMD